MMVRVMVGFWGRGDLANSCHPDHLTKLLIVSYPKVVAFKSLCFGSTLRSCLLEIDYCCFHTYWTSNIYEVLWGILRWTQGYLEVDLKNYRHSCFLLSLFIPPHISNADLAKGYSEQCHEPSISVQFSRSVVSNSLLPQVWPESNPLRLYSHPVNFH